MKMSPAEGEAEAKEMSRRNGLLNVAICCVKTQPVAKKRSALRFLGLRRVRVPVRVLVWAWVWAWVWAPSAIRKHFLLPILVACPAAIINANGFCGALNNILQLRPKRAASRNIGNRSSSSSSNLYKKVSYRQPRQTHTIYKKKYRKIT